MSFAHDEFMADWRDVREATGVDRRIQQREYDLVMSAIQGRYRPTPAPASPWARPEPSWLAEARKHMGKAEVPGPKHSPFVLGLWNLLGRPYTDDKTPWCGGFVGYCLRQAMPGMALPKVPERALAWADWGKSSGPAVGAIAVFGRTGGGHVGFAVGQRSDAIYVLGGNQANAVNIMPIKKDRLVGFRWPASLPSPPAGLPPMTGGTVSRNEA
jgi:uncharacterized protein (TIGR02594 family)